MPKFLTITIAVLIALGFVWFVFIQNHEVPPPAGWPQEVKFYKNIATSIITVTDANTGTMLFSYRAGVGITPVSFERTSSKHWTVKFEQIEP